MEKSRKKLPELSKSKNPDGKSVEEALKSSFLVGSVENSKENGVRVSSNGKEDLVGDDLEGGVVAVVKKTKVVETEIEVKGGGDSENVQELISFNDAENKEVGDCVGSNDGISLLVDVSSGMGREDGGDFNGREDGGSSNEKVENPDVKIREMIDSEDGEEDDSNDGDYEFCVGDFVWGKIKSYPWWPGQIYDSSDASDYALKLKRRDRLLVAYFDGTFAWCHPSQLKPFEKNFEEMSKQSSTKSFVNAVRNAVDEIGRLVELKMTCSCVPKESLVGLARPLAANSGVKPGVLVPEGGIAKLWNYLFGPSECLSELKHVARVISINNMLEFTELKCWLSTFYRVGGGYQLPLYHDPRPIAGLENNHNMALEFIHDAEGPIKGPIEEETNQSLMQKCLMGSENGKHPRRKQKSIAEIMEGYVDTLAKNAEEDVSKEGTGLGNRAQSSLRKKMKGKDEANGGTSLSSRPKRRKVTKLLESTSATGIEIPTVERDVSKAKEKMRKVILLREKKKSKASHTESDDVSKVETNASPSSVEKETVQRGDGEATEQTEKSFLSRERKRSKYLSPPYTNINRRQTKKDFGAEFLKISSEARVAERMTRAAANLIESESPAILMCSNEVLQKKDSKQVVAGHEKSDTSNAETMKLDQSTVIDTMKVKASAKDVLSGIWSTAINLKSLKKDSLDLVEGFVSIFRSSVYCNGTHYKIYNKSRPGRKRKTRDSEPVSSEKYQNQTEQKSPEQRSRRTKIKKNEEAKTMKDDKRKSDEPILKQAVDEKTKSRGTDGKEKSDRHKLKQAGDMKTKGRGTDRKEKSDKHKLKQARDAKTKGRGTDGKEKSDKPKLKQVGDVETKDRGTDGKEKSDKSKVGQVTRSEDKKRNDTPSDGKEKSNKPKLRQVTRSQDKKRKDAESDGKAASDINAKTDGKASPTYLFVTFGPTSSLPSKNDLIKIYNKFGSLNEEETEMFYNNCCALVVFLRSSDAEEAFKSSQLASPFGDSSCNFEIRGSSSAYKMRKLEGISNAKPSPVQVGGKALENEFGSETSVGEGSPLDYVKQKLEMIGSVLANSDGKMSPELKSKVEGEVNDLLNKVNKVVGSSLS